MQPFGVLGWFRGVLLGFRDGSGGVAGSSGWVPGFTDTHRILQALKLNRDVTIIINFENIADDNALFGKAKKKIINFRNLSDTAIGLRVLKIAF